MIKFKGGLSFGCFSNDLIFKVDGDQLVNYIVTSTREGMLSCKRFQFDLRSVESYKVDGPNWVVEEMESMQDD